MKYIGKKNVCNLFSLFVSFCFLPPGAETAEWRSETSVAASKRITIMTTYLYITSLSAINVVNNYWRKYVESLIPKVLNLHARYFLSDESFFLRIRLEYIHVMCVHNFVNMYWEYTAHMYLYYTHRRKLGGISGLNPLNFFTALL